jgi:hypothetical protein
MMVQSACHASSKLLATQNLGRPKCPCCGNVLLIAEGSRFNSRGRIDHDWSCDDCDHEFATSVRLPPY